MSFWLGGCLPDRQTTTPTPKDSRAKKRQIRTPPKAVAFDPLYAPAHGNLGAQYARLARFRSAELELRKAIELDSGTGVYYSDLAWVLANEGQEREAQSQAPRGVDLDAVNPKAHLLLGYLLANHPETRASALSHLIFAAREIPEAHQILAGVYRATGNEILARQEMQRYQDAIGETPKPAEYDEAAARDPKDGH